jgi:hypothetical protein
MNVTNLSLLCSFVLLPCSVENCNHTHSMIHDFIRDSDSPTFDLTVSLFHAATTGSHFSAHSTDPQVLETRRLNSLHQVIPRPTKRIVEQWRHELAVRGEPWSDITVHAESAHIIAVSIPIKFFDQHPPHHVLHADVPRFCDLLNMFAAYPHTEYIEQCAAFETHNRYASPLVQTGTYTRPGLMHQHGLTGRGQIITVADTGVAHGNCFFVDPAVPTPIDSVNFAHRKIVSYVNTRGKSYDLPDGHGTHTACSIAGHILPSAIDAASETDAVTLKRLAQYNGVAYEAKLAVFDVNDGLTSGKIKPPKDIYSKYYQLAYASMGARISSNSWGAKNGSYIGQWTGRTGILALHLMSFC